NPELQARVRLRRRLEGGHPRLELRRRAIAAADETRPNSLASEIGELALDRLDEDLHQRVDLLGRPGPVLGREGIDGERLDADVDRGLDGAPERTGALAVTGGDGESARGSLAAAPVHDDRDRACHLR